MAAVMKLKIDVDVVQNSVLLSSQLLRSVENLIATTGIQVAMPPWFPYNASS